ncbi:putative adhesin [Streptomyces sp. NPDC001594]|uniref:putative adhesin n=1 Tax=Streptomyces sp. NPDC001594 TaxID=3364590 RepID=UPI00368EB5A9
MGYILLGHGGLDGDPGVTPPEMEFVAIPQGTTIQFYADAGQGLWFGRDDLDVWQQVPPYLPALGSGEVTYNLALQAPDVPWVEEFAAAEPGFAGHRIVLAGADGTPDPLPMCTGTRETCPTDPRQVAAGATHHCEGILARFHGDLHWLACTTIDHADQAVVDAALGGRPTDVPLGADPDRIADEAAERAIARVNRANVERAYDQQDMHFRAAGSAVLIGHGHEPGIAHYVRVQSRPVRGVLTVHRAGGALHPAGRFEVRGVPPERRAPVRVALGRFSDYEVVFV